MKRFLLTCLLAIIIISVMLVFMPKDFADVIPQNSAATCYVYCRNTIENAINIGYGYIVKCSAAELSGVMSNCDLIDGVSLRVAADENRFWQIVEQCGLRDIKTETFSTLITVCGYCPKIRGGAYVGDDFINLQLAYSDGTVYVGSPLILGSF